MEDLNIEIIKKRIRERLEKRGGPIGCLSSDHECPARSFLLPAGLIKGLKRAVKKIPFSEKVYSAIMNRYVKGL